MILMPVQCSKSEEREEPGGGVCIEIRRSVGSWPVEPLWEH